MVGTFIDKNILFIIIFNIFVRILVKNVAKVL